MDYWCCLNIRVDDLLDSCVYGVVRIIGLKLTLGVIIMERFYGVGGIGK